MRVPFFDSLHRRSITRFATLLVATLVLPLVGCTSGLRPAATSASTQQEEMREIKQRLVEIQRQGAMTRVQMEELERRLARLEAHAGLAPSERRRPTSRPAPETREPNRGQDRARSQTQPPTRNPNSGERQPAPIEPASAGVTGQDIVLEPPASAPEPTGGATPRTEPPQPVPPLGDSPAAQPAAAGAPISAAAQAIYDRGYTLYHQGRYLDAEASFQRFLQAHSDTDLADNAQYWIGEARYARGDVPGSLAAFREVVARHPNGNKVPDALLKAGQSLERLGDTESARRTYRELVDKFPNSAAALRGQERLTALP